MAWNRSPQTLRLALAALLAALSPALSAQNLIANPHFDTSLQGWLQTLNNVTWDGTIDAGGSSSSGSELAFVDSSIVGGYTSPISQCVPLTIGSRYHLGAKIFVPTGQTAAGSAFLLLVPYPTAGCSGPPPPALGPILQTTLVVPSGAWVDSSLTFDNTFAHSGQLLTTLSPGSVGHFRANFDDVVLEEVPVATGCSANSLTLCLQGSRFEVTATFDTGSGPTGAHAGPIGNSGYFWFFNGGNVEAVVKVIDGCGVNDKFWFFAGGLTNVHTVITVRDTQTGASKTYINPASTAFQPVQDTSAFDCP